MTKYTVEIQRSVVQTVEVEIEAGSISEAEGIAFEKAGDIDFSGKEKSADYSVSVINMEGG